MKEENHLEEERVDCETTTSVNPINSKSIVDALKEEELPFRESFSGKKNLVLERLLILLIIPLITTCIMVSLMV
jgi:hypothetical protein